MRCSSCGRHISKPALELAGAKFGPVCAQKVLQAAGQLAYRRASSAPSFDPNAVHRDPCTRDLFEEATA